MKIAYVSNINIPDDWGHSIQVMNMSSAFSFGGVDLILFVPNRNMPIKTDPFIYYGIKESFKIRKLFCIDFYVGNKNYFLYYLRLLSFYISAFFYFLFKRDFDLIYSRDDYASFFLNNVVLEKHSFPKNPNFIQKIAFKRARKIVVLTSFLKEKFASIGVDREKIFISPDAVDISLFLEKNSLSKKDFGFSDGDFLIGYVGALKTMGMDKGISILFDTVKSLPENFKVLIVGGWGDDLVYYKNLAKNLSIESRVFFTGKVPHSEVSKYMKSCDVLVAPFPENEHFSFYMSPLKIFEYMASQRPIITTYLPSIREVLTHNEDALLTKAGDLHSLKDSIELVYKDKGLREKLSLNAFKLVRDRYTWKKRAENILQFINK